MKVKARGFDYCYDQIAGEGAFVEAVNKKLSDYWVSTGREMPVLDAAMDVLAELYNDIKSDISK